MGYLNQWLECYRSHDNAQNKNILDQKLKQVNDQITYFRKDAAWKEQKQRNLNSEISELENLLIRKKNQKQSLETEVKEVHAKCRALEQNAEEIRNNHRNQVNHTTMNITEVLRACN